jgi:2-polyprenyl-3-methyl-5-hydroxy-6-metoxy-1,4-benzoquinol methylase/ribosomal protein S27E
MTAPQVNRVRMTENEIRPRELLGEQARLFAEDVARLMRHRADFVERKCPACDSDDHTKTLEKTGMQFVTCNACGTLFANPCPRPAHMEEYYRTSQNYEFWSKHIFPASEPARREKIFRPRVERVLAICETFGVPTRTMLEVGAGFGSFCLEMTRAGRFKRIIAVEPTPSLAEDCRKRGLEVIEKPIEQLEKSSLVGNGDQIDVIANFEVIEHLFSPREFVQKCANLLNPGGIFIVTCPNSRGFDVLELGVHSSVIDAEHVNLFHPASLARLLDVCGFDVIEKQTPGRLDAELVRKGMLAGQIDPSTRPFLRRLLIDNWDDYGELFQDFLASNLLSSNMLLVGRKRAITDPRC